MSKEVELNGPRDLFSTIHRGREEPCNPIVSADHVFHRLKTPSMKRRETVSSKRAEVGTRAISLVVGELEGRVAVSDLGHEAITRHFGDDRSRCNAKAAPVSADDRLLWKDCPTNPVSVDENKRG